MISETDIRLAAPSDAVGIAGLSRRSIERGLEWRWTPRRVMNAMSDADTHVIVARRGNDLLGFAIMSYGDEDAHLQLLATQTRCRRQGMGSSLLRWLEASARAAGIATVRLEVRADNVNAQAFYRHHGFHATEQRAGYYQGVADAVRMVKPLRLGAPEG